MSSKEDAESPASEPAFACGIEASALLNCVASKQYSEAKCKPLLQKLRSCIEKKVIRIQIFNTCPVSDRNRSSSQLTVQKIVKFSLLPDKEPASKKPTEGNKEGAAKDSSK